MNSPEPLRFFLGCSTPGGFCSLFDEFLAPRNGWQVTLLKGGPGTGKSTLLRKVLRLAQETGGAPEEIHCTSDVSSLDGVVLPKQRMVWLDATPPHAAEPRFPGAVEEVLSLALWDKDALREQREKIVSLGEECSRRHRLARRFLGAAAAFRAEAGTLLRPCTDSGRTAAAAEALALRELPSGRGPGRETRRFLSAVTNEGPVTFFKTAEQLCPRLFLLADPWGIWAPALLASLREKALASGQDIITCPCQLNPNATGHLLLPALGLGFLTVEKAPEEMPGEVLPADRFISPAGLRSVRKRLAFLKKAEHFFLAEAAAEMAEAKALHDRLEAIYGGAMDYEALGRLTEEALEALRKRLC